MNETLYTMLVMMSTAIAVPIVLNSLIYEKFIKILSVMTTFNFERKPFTCSLCMTFWTTMTMVFAFGEYSAMLFLFPFVCAFAADIVDKQLNTF